MTFLVAEVVPPAGPILVPALASLAALCALIVAWGMVKLIDAIVRGFFGKVEGALAWIPYAGKVAEHSVHAVEQKITHALGTAERKLDGAIAWSWHNLAALVHWLGREIEGGAQTAWHIAQRMEAFVHRRELHHAIRAEVAPVKATAHTAAHEAHLANVGAKAVANTVAHGVYPRIKAGEVYDRTVVRPNVRTAKAEAKAAEDAAIASYKYLTKHKASLLTGVFTGAFAWALTRLGGGWIRCSNWRKIGKRVCGLPTSLIDDLLGFALATEVVIDPEAVARAALALEDAFEDTIKRIAD